MNDERDDKLIAAASRLATEISPERDLWPDIAEAIERPPARRWTPMFAQAAAVLVLVAASSGITWYAVNDHRPIVTYQPELAFEHASFGAQYSLGPDFQDARAMLSAELEAELEGLSADERANIETSLAVMQDAIEIINAELERDPENIYLQEMLLKAYRDELALMRRVGGLARNVMLRNDI